MQHVLVAQLLEKVLSELFRIKYTGSNLGKQTLTTCISQRPGPAVRLFMLLTAC